MNTLTSFSKSALQAIQEEMGWNRSNESYLRPTRLGVTVRLRTQCSPRSGPFSALCTCAVPPAHPDDPAGQLGTPGRGGREDVVQDPTAGQERRV